MCIIVNHHHFCGHQTRQKLYCLSHGSHESLVRDFNDVYFCSDCSLNRSLTVTFRPSVRNLTQRAHLEALDIVFRWDEWAENNPVFSRVDPYGLEVDGILSPRDENYIVQLLVATHKIFDSVHEIQHPRSSQAMRQLDMQLVGTLCRNDARKVEYKWMKAEFKKNKTTDPAFQRDLKVALKPHSLSKLAADDWECSICFTVYGETGEADEPPELPMKVQCPGGHIFGGDCIKKWFSEGHGHCPNCRAKFELTAEFPKRIAEEIEWLEAMRGKRPKDFVVDNFGDLDIVRIVVDGDVDENELNQTAEFLARIGLTEDALS